MKKTISGGSAAIMLALASFAAGAQQKPVDIGFIGTLSTPAGYIGEDEARRLHAGRQGGRRQARRRGGQRARRGRRAQARQRQADCRQDGAERRAPVHRHQLLERDGRGRADGAQCRRLLRQPERRPSNYAGKACSPNYFSVAFQNDSYADTAGMAANELGAKRVVIMAPNCRRGATRSPASSAPTRVRSPTRSTPSWSRRTSRSNWRASARSIPTRSSSSIRAARAST